MTESEIKTIINEIQNAIKVAAASTKTGVNLTCDFHNIHWNDNGEISFNTKVELIDNYSEIPVKDNSYLETDSYFYDSEAGCYPSKNWNYHADALDIPREAFGVQFNVNGENYTLIGLKSNSPKYPIIVRKYLGGQYKAPLGFRHYIIEANRKREIERRKENNNKSRRKR